MSAGSETRAAANVDQTEAPPAPVASFDDFAQAPIAKPAAAPPAVMPQYASAMDGRVLELTPARFTDMSGSPSASAEWGAEHNKVCRFIHTPISC
jgi:hypothetical protein